MGTVDRPDLQNYSLSWDSASVCIPVTAVTLLKFPADTHLYCAGLTWHLDNQWVQVLGKSFHETSCKCISSQFMFNFHIWRPQKMTILFHVFIFVAPVINQSQTGNYWSITDQWHHYHLKAYPLSFPVVYNFTCFTQSDKQYEQLFHMTLNS